MSLVWAGAIVTRAKKEGRIVDEFATKTIIDEINKFGTKCAGEALFKLLLFHRVNILPEMILYIDL